MNIVVCVQQSLDARLPLEVTPEGAVVQKELSPIFVADLSDRCALEQAMRICGEVANSRVTVITVGPKRAKGLLADCLARGADHAVHLQVSDSSQVDSFAIARPLADEIKRLGFDLILCGDRALDDGPSEVGPIVAELLDIAQATEVVRLDVFPDENRLAAERKLERGYRQILEVDLPALVTVDGSSCQPRYVSNRARRYATKTIAEHCHTVLIQDQAVVNEGSSLRKVLRVSPPRPRVKKIAQPHAALSAEERLAVIMGGGAPSAKSGGTIAGDPEQAADGIIAFLKEIGVL